MGLTLCLSLPLWCPEVLMWSFLPLRSPSQISVPSQVTAFLMPSTLITFHASLDFYLAQIAKEILGKESAGR